MISRCVPFKGLRVPWIGLKSHDPSRRADEAGYAKRDASRMRSHIVDHASRRYSRQDGSLHHDFMFSAPEANFPGEEQTHPQTLGYAGTNPNPVAVSGKSV